MRLLAIGVRTVVLNIAWYSVSALSRSLFCARSKLKEFVAQYEVDFAASSCFVQACVFGNLRGTSRGSTRELTLWWSRGPWRCWAFIIYAQIIQIYNLMYWCIHKVWLKQPSKPGNINLFTVWARLKPLFDIPHNWLETLTQRSLPRLSVATNAESIVWMWLKCLPLSAKASQSTSCFPARWATALSRYTLSYVVSNSSNVCT